MAEKKQTLAIELPPLHPAQREVAASPARFKVLAAGRRFGKTRLGIFLCLAEALKGGFAFWVSPSYPISLIGWRLLKRVARQIPGIEIREAEHRAEFPTGGVVEIKSAHNPDSLLGAGLDLVVVDEAAFVPEDTWEVALRPALADRKGAALFISTPRGRGLFYRLWKDGGGDEDDPGEQKEGWQSWRFPTSANPYIDPKEIAKAEAQLPKLVFQQEFLARFTQHYGAMFQRDWFASLSEAPQGRYYRFWDLAFSPEGEDFSVGQKGALVDGQLIIADVVRGRWDWPNLRRTIIETTLEDGPDVAVGIEQVSAQLAAIQDLMASPDLVGYTVKGIPIRVPGRSVRALYENLPRDKAAKAARAASWLAKAEAGNVVLVEAPWNKGWLDRVCDFPLTGSPDDEVDATSGLEQMIGKPKRIEWGWV